MVFAADCLVIDRRRPSSEAVSAPAAIARMAKSWTGRTSSWPRRASSAVAASTSVRKPPSSSSARSAPERDMREGYDTGRTTARVSIIRQPGCRIEERDMTVTGITHHRAEVNGTTLHYVAAGTTGSPILLVHGFPETWWAFHKLIPLPATNHRVFAVDLRGFGDSDNQPGEYGSAASAEDLHQLIAHLDVGPVHVTGQDISGGTVFRLAATHPPDVLSFTAIETGLAGFGAEGLADVT